MSPSSVHSYISALWAHHKAMGLLSHQGNWRLHMTLKGIRRLGSSSRPPRHPLSLDDLKAMFMLINTFLPQDLVFWSALTLAFRALLRKGHYTLSPHTLCWGNLSLYPDHLVLIIPSSKTDQFGTRPHRIVLNSSPGSCLCPVFWLSELSRVHNPLESDFVFRVPTPHGWAPLDYAWFNARLKDLALRVGLSPVSVSTHSLRHGGASLMASLGSSMMEIRARGGWSSSAIFRYLHHSVDSLKTFDTLISSNV